MMKTFISYAKTPAQVDLIDGLCLLPVPVDETYLVFFNKACIGLIANDDTGYMVDSMVVPDIESAVMFVIHRFLGGNFMNPN